MIPPGSRYDQAERQFVDTHLYSEWGYPLAEDDRTAGPWTPTLSSLSVRVRTTSRDTLYRVQTTRPVVPQPFEYYAKDTENIQFLAYKFLGDAKRWWEIADANQKVWYPLDLKMGDFIVIPV